MCIEEIQNLDRLTQRIAAAVSSVTPDILRRTSAEVDYRLERPGLPNGAHIETH